ncbi:hypothetical protein [Thiomicrorhabdus aquaedulcis]|uniref:hypothetical protein n=1 Tax=Thiomicrorhabdus aquaedulcis TaxID=2211106 RepID=UPI000FD7D17F|nr:hypothetical protein [Thiomicrorhabdus aquaedulcis]
MATVTVGVRLGYMNVEIDLDHIETDDLVRELKSRRKTDYSDVADEMFANLFYKNIPLKEVLHDLLKDCESYNPALVERLFNSQ